MYAPPPIFPAFLFLLTSLLTTCSGASSTSPGNAAPSLDFHGKIIAFQENAAHDQFEDGFATYHATQLEILSSDSPDSLTIYHPANAIVPALWREPGQQLRFQLAPSDVNADMLFAAALKEIQWD